MPRPLSPLELSFLCELAQMKDDPKNKARAMQAVNSTAPGLGKAAKEVALALLGEDKHPRPEVQKAAQGFRDWAKGILMPKKKKVSAYP